MGYTNWKDANPNGNCAYLFTKVTTFKNHDFVAVYTFSVSDRSWEQGEMGGRDLLDQLGAQLVHNLPVRRGCCGVLHPWYVPGRVEEKKSDLELEIKFRQTRWTVSTPSSMAWESRTEWRDLSSRAG